MSQLDQNTTNLQNILEKVNSLPSGGTGSGVEVTAKPGQLIRVKEVDEEGKPTAWEPVPWGWVEGGMVEILPETTLTMDDEGMIAITTEVPQLVAGETYTVNWNGVEYNCVAQVLTEEAGTPGVSLGNLGSMTGTDTGEPFIIVRLPDDSIAEAGYYVLIGAFDGSTSVTLSISGEFIHPIPGNLLPEGVPYVERTSGEILPTTTLDSSNNEITTPISIEVGSTYTVNYNGTAFECVCQDISAMIPGSTALGNLGQVGMGEDTGEPFLVAVLPPELVEQNGYWGTVTTFDGSTEFTISIIGDSVSFHKININCMPDNIDHPVLVVYDADDSMGKATHTPVEIVGQCLLSKKAGFFVNSKGTLPLCYADGTQAIFDNIWYKDGGLVRSYVVIAEDGTISSYGYEESITLS